MSRQDSRQISDVKIMLKQGAEGVGIVGVEKTGSVGLVDTYALIMSDGTRHTFEVTNGNGIASIEKTATSGLVDTYTITFDDGTTYDYNVTNGQDGEDGGMSAKILITSNAGSTVTVTLPSGRVKTATQVSGSTTQWECYTTEYGTHTVSSTLSGYTQTGTVSVDQCKIYTITVTHFSATIKVAYTAGATCTCVGGSESYTATSNPQTFTVHHADTYVVTVSNPNESVSQNVVITTNGQSENITVELMTTRHCYIRSASNDTVSFTDATGAKTCVTDEYGYGEVDITYPPSGLSITFASNIAYDPSNLSQKYSKSITMDRNSSNILFIMPGDDNNVMYWYGYQSGLTDNRLENAVSADMGNANSVKSPTYYTNHIELATRISTSSGYSASGVKKKTVIDDSASHTMHAIANARNSSSTGSPILTYASSTFVMGDYTNSTSKTLLTYTCPANKTPMVCDRALDVQGYDHISQLHAFWFEL